MKHLPKYVSLFLIFFLPCLYLNGQSGNVSLQVQGGQFNGFATISPDDNTVITRSGDVIDVKKGVVLHKGLQLGEIFMMDDNQHLVSLKQSEVQVIDYTTNGLTKSLKLTAFSSSQYAPVSRNGEWFVYLHKNEEDYPLVDETDDRNNQALAEHTGKPNQLHVVRLPEGKWTRSISTGFEGIYNYAVEGNVVALTGYYSDREGTFVKYFDLRDGHEMGGQKIAEDDQYHTIVALSPRSDYFFAYGGGKEAGTYAALDVRTGKNLASLGLEELALFHSGEYRFSADGNRLFIISAKGAGQNPKIIIVDLVKDKVLYSKETKGMLLSYILSDDLKTGILQYMTTTTYPYTYWTELHNFEKKEVSAFNLPNDSYNAINVNRIFTHKGNYWLQYVMNMTKNIANIEYYNYREHRVEKSVELLNLVQPVALSFHHATKDLFFTYNRTAYFNGPLYKISLDKLFGLSKVFLGDSCGEYALHEGRNLIAQGQMRYGYSSAGGKLKNKEDSLNNYRINSRVCIKPIGVETEICRIQLPVGHVAEYMFFDEPGHTLAFYTTKLPHIQYKNGVPLTLKFDYSKQINTLDVESKAWTPKLRIHPSDVVHTLRENTPVLILDHSLRHTYVFGFDSVLCRPGGHYVVGDPDFKTGTPSYLVKVDVSSGKIIKSYGQKDFTRLDYLYHSDRYLVFRSTIGLASNIVVFDHDLNPVLEVPIPGSSGSEGRIDAENTRFLLTIRAHPDYTALSDSTFVYRLADGALVDAFETPPVFQNEMVFTGHHCIFPNAIFDLGKKQTTLKWAIFKEMDVVATTPDHYYWAGKTVAEALRFTRNNTSLPFRQYDLLYNRPDKVLATLPNPDHDLVEMYKKAYLKRLEKAGFRESDLSADVDLPELKVLNQNLPFETNQPQLELTVTASDAKYLLDRVQVWVNDVPVFGKNGISLREGKLKKWKDTLSIQLSSGSNQIQVSCLNEKGVESLLEDITINYRAPARKPDLYLLALGVSRYADSSMDLRYAARDAANVVDLFGGQKGVFGNVYAKQLINEQVTKIQVLALKDWLKQSKIDDRVIIFMAGHGLVDANLDYYLATYDLDFNNPAVKGLPYDAIDNLLDGIPARQKLILLDACHSGEIDKESVVLVKEKQAENGAVTFRSFETHPVAQQLGLQNSFDLMKTLFVDLRRSSGATAISSAGGMEFAMEGDAWKNGVFTWFLKKGLKGNDADTNKDGAVMISELQKWLGEVVEKVTNGHQKPTFRAENILNDWRIW